jgi:pseudaminic acid biosynthesis-associated methylase
MLQLLKQHGVEIGAAPGENGHARGTTLTLLPVYGDMITISTLSEVEGPDGKRTPVMILVQHTGATTKGKLGTAKTGYEVVDVNANACAQLVKLDIRAVNANLLDYVPLTAWDLVLTKGLLIDIPPAQLELAFGVLYRSSRRYICIAECYNPAPQTIEDWGNAGRLFQRDFAGEMTDMFPDLELVACGFAYNRGQRQEDSITWFLLERGHL